MQILSYPERVNCLLMFVKSEKQLKQNIFTLPTGVHLTFDSNDYFKRYLIRLIPTYI